MSLRVWLPLTKDLRNQGLDDVTVANNGATLNSAGKLGSCYYFNATSQFINLTNYMNALKTFTNYSMSAWVFIETKANDHSASILSSGNWNQATGQLVFGFHSWSTNHYTKLLVPNTSGWSNGINYDFMQNTWYHITITYNGSKTLAYVNGTKIGEYNGGGIATTSETNNLYVGCATYYSSFNLRGKLNDVRIYDHCLSPMEVKELSKGLVLHYPLNRGGFGNENLLSRYVVPGQAGPTSTAAGGRTTWLGDYKITIPATENADTYFRLFMSEQLVSGQTYTISCQVDGLLSGSVYRFPMFAQSNTAMGVLNLDHNGLNSLTFTMNWTGTQTAATGTNGETVYVNFLDDSARTIASGQGPITISNFKLEEGDKVTPWCPNVLDSLYNAMGLNSTIEYDCSGFCNNGTKNGTYSYTSDTPKYAVSTNFSGTETIAIATTGADILTLSCWAKTSKSKSTSQMMVADSASKLCCSFYQGNFISFYGGNSGYDTGSKCFLGSEYKENEWNHFVSVKTGEGTRDCYCNGVKLTPTTNDWWSTAAGFWIGNRNTGGNLPFYGQICDVRAYATALSADDVKSLYQNSAYIDSSGNVYGAVHSEV